MRAGRLENVRPLPADRRCHQRLPATARRRQQVTSLGNYFARTNVPPLSIHNVKGLKIHANNLDYPAAAPPAKGLANNSTANWLYLQDCSGVSLQENLTPA